MTFALFVLATLQAPPGTEIHLVPVTRTGASLSIGPPRNITARAGYDNQPSFSPDGRSVYYSSAREGQTDIFRFDMADGRTTRITDTPESEYSPTVMPHGEHLSVVRVERDSTQRLWQFTLSGAAVKPVLESAKPVGYHAWRDGRTVYLFVLGSPPTLQRADVASGQAEPVARDIGRTILPIPGRGTVSFSQRDTAGGPLSLRELDPGTGTIRPLAPLPSGNEFVAWTREGDLLSASGNRLLRWNEASRDWEPIARFTEPGLQRISRIAVSPLGDWIALVGDEPARSP